MKKIFKNIFLITYSIGLITPIMCCKQTNDIKTIEILSDLTDLTVTEQQTQLTEPIEAKCYGSDKKEISIDIQFLLQFESNDPLPNWICLTDKNEIKLMGGKEQGCYSFKITAFNSKEQIYSQPKLFKINVIPERHILPDSISLDIENDRYCMYGEENNLPISVVPYKKGQEEQHLINSCFFEISVLEGKTQDLAGNKLFTIKQTGEDIKLVISSNIDSTYIGDYELKVVATLLDKHTIKTLKQITIHLDNIYYQVDSTNYYVYQRDSIENDWTLSWVPSETTSISNVKDKIQNKYVTKVAANLCSKSQITNLVQLVLPKTVTTIGSQAFANQKALCLCEMPGLKYVGNKAFYNDSVMEYDTKKEYPILEVVKDSAFENCLKLNLDTFQDLTWIGDFAFKNAGLSEFWCGENCAYIGNECFASNSKLEKFRILAQKPPILGGGAFSKCDKLTKICVLADYVDIYKSDQYWLQYQSIIEGI